MARNLKNRLCELCEILEIREQIPRDQLSMQMKFCGEDGCYQDARQGQALDGIAQQQKTRTPRAAIEKTLATRNGSTGRETVLFNEIRLGAL